MKTVRYAFILLAAVFVSGAAAHLSARPRQNPKVRVKEITPALVGGNLVLNLRIENLFTPKIVGTIQSGLPSIVQIHIQLLENQRVRLFDKSIFKRITYNIWDEYYTVECDTVIEKVRNFEALKVKSSLLRNLVLLARKRLNPASHYLLRIRAGISPISAIQSHKFNSWLRESRTTQSEIVSDERSSGFRLNISNLVSFFIGNDHRRKSRSAIEEFTFQLMDLQR